MSSLKQIVKRLVKYCWLGQVNSLISSSQRMLLLADSIVVEVAALRSLIVDFLLLLALQFIQGKLGFVVLTVGPLSVFPCSVSLFP